ncbi:hypothetical protein [Nostoc sp.]
MGNEVSTMSFQFLLSSITIGNTN